MVVSAVSFSVFMRESRKPSSYLRRSVTSRALLKAALANAISRIDGTLNNDEQRVEGIYDDLYPGVGPSLEDPGANNDENGGYWSNRVFMPFGEVDTAFTVSTLTLESLAYLPPAIINEVRIFSRKTRTAEWQNMAFDLGRYAFCAVDVSDCFDINKVRANERRSSASNCRFNLSPLFPDNAAQLDAVFDKASNLTPNYFVSLADFNVVAGKGNPFAPWMDYIGTRNGQIYSKSDHATVSNALFITDTWFPPTNNIGGVTKKVYNLEAGSKNQPWSTYDASSAEDALDAANDPGVAAPIFKMVQGVGMACLYDYLDKDQVPLSYCMPCTETAPMICALGMDQNTSIKIARKVEDVATGDYGTPVEEDGVQKYPYTVTVKKCVLNVKVLDLAASGVMAFPFKRAHIKNNYKTSFSGEALFRIFFAPKNIDSRLQAGGEDTYVHPLRGQRLDAVQGGWKNGVYSARASNIKGERNFSFAHEIVSQEDALAEFDASAESAEPDSNLSLFYIVEKKNNKTDDVEQWYSFDGLASDTKCFQPRDEKGIICDWWDDLVKGGKSQLPMPQDGVWQELPSGEGRNADNPLNGQEFVPHVAVWVRAFNGDDTYDMVPARPEDDEIYGDRSQMQLGEWKTLAGGEDNSPILEFPGNIIIKLGYKEHVQQAQAAGGGEGETLEFSQWNRLYVADPRYNYAPENWVAVTVNQDEALRKENWLTSIDGLLGRPDGRDGDIFMFTSDQEYLQSIGELAFIPRVGDSATSGNQINRHYLAYTDLNGAGFNKRKGGNVFEMLDHLGQSEFYWRTYATYDKGDGVDNIYSLREGGTGPNDGTACEIKSGNNDFRANPYSQDPRIMAAVVEGTPIDFYAASTNDFNTLYSNPGAAKPEDARDYIFTGDKEFQNSYGYIEGFSGVATRIREAFRRSAIESNAKTGKNMNWENVFDNLNWKSSERGDEQYDFLGATLQDPLHEVDRKFLHAFWRDCFQNRQQLFLVFIRAEPLTVGGMGFGSLAAAQLGARGVALVWRDPLPPVKNRQARQQRTALTRPNQWRQMFEQSGPHRTRILFYHQID